MASSSPDLDQFRHDAAAITGNPVADYGMLPDPRHLSGGGPHCGLTDLIRIDRFHYPRAAHVGSTTEDYSARQARDRNTVDDRAAAVDGPDDWPRGGRAAWIRHNNLIVRQLQAGDPELGALRAINFTPDGAALKRYDTLHPHDGPNGDGVIASKDTVAWHTHYEFHRDTLGTSLMRRTLARLLQIMRAAIANTSLTPATTGDDMEQTEVLSQGTPGYAGQQLATVWAFTWKSAADAAAGVSRLEAAVAADAVRDQAMAAAIAAIGAATGADLSPVIAAVNAVRDEARTKFAELLTAVGEAEDRAAAAEAEVGRLRAALHMAAQAEADATTP